MSEDQVTQTEEQEVLEGFDLEAWKQQGVVVLDLKKKKVSELQSEIAKLQGEINQIETYLNGKNGTKKKRIRLRPTIWKFLISHPNQPILLENIIHGVTEQIPKAKADAIRTSVVRLAKDVDEVTVTEDGAFLYQPV